jgi:hypothetical protein
MDREFATAFVSDHKTAAASFCYPRHLAARVPSEHQRMSACSDGVRSQSRRLNR